MCFSRLGNWELNESPETLINVTIYCEENLSIKHYLIIHQKTIPITQHPNKLFRLGGMVGEIQILIIYLCFLFIYFNEEQQSSEMVISRRINTNYNSGL